MAEGGEEQWERCGSAFPSTDLCRASVHLPLRHTSEALTFTNGREAVVTHLFDLSRSQLCHCLQNIPMKVLVGFLGGGYQWNSLV